MGAFHVFVSAIIHAAFISILHDFINCHTVFLFATKFINNHRRKRSTSYFIFPQFSKQEVGKSSACQDSSNALRHTPPRQTCSLTSTLMARKLQESLGGLLDRQATKIPNKETSIAPIGIKIISSLVLPA